MSLSYFFINKLRKSIFREEHAPEYAQEYKKLKRDLFAGVKVYKSQATMHYGIGNISHAISLLRANEGLPIITHRDNDPNNVYYCLYEFASKEDKKKWSALRNSTKDKVLNLGASGYFQNVKEKDDGIEGQMSFNFYSDGSFYLTEDD